jgi:uncharacterized protein (DUF305 family)
VSEQDPHHATDEEPPLTPRTRLRDLASAAIIAVVLAGCGPDVGGPRGMAPDARSSDPGGRSGANEELEDGRDDASSFNDADVEFMQGMIPHHMQAVRMAEMVPDRTASDELDQLAENIITSQTEEISLMVELLRDAGADAPPMGGGGMGMDGDGMGGMGSEGMLSPDEMHELMASDGREFDRLWVDAMIDHHEGAVDAARRLVADGEHPRVRELAENIIAEQESEIEQMRTWQDEWEPS